MAQSDQEASSSNSSCSNSTRNWKYDIFLSFRGEDTRKSFTDHLYTTLCKKGFKVFRDDEELERGEIISEKLLQAIEDSRFAIVVVSKNYASSTWCLDELRHILAPRKKSHQQVLPIFYQVHPSDVRHQRGSFAEAFAILEDKFQEDQPKVKKWRDSLTEVANLSGWDSKEWHETELIERVVEELGTKLRGSFTPNNDILIGIDERVHKLESHLEIGLNDVRFVGIWGLGGVGKTATARAGFEKFRSQFNISCFLDNVRTIFSERDGEVQLQRKLLSYPKIRNMDIGDAFEGKSAIQNLCFNKKVLLILDDVSSITQFQNLANSASWFGPGSRVIITTRDLHLLKAHGVHEVYEVKTMDKDESLQLFCQKAFKRDKPPEDFLELSKSVCGYAGGLPLALCVLGSFLYGRSVLEWKDALDMLKKDPNEDIFKILRISYDALNYTEKSIFLDIACFFNHRKQTKIIEILKSCGLNSKIGINTLTEKSLLKVRGGKYLEMHDLLEQMGRSIVLEESPCDAGKRSRLWSNDDIDEVLEKNMGTKVIQAIVSNTSCKACWDPEAFSSLCNLRLLIISSGSSLPDGLKCLSNALKVLHWTKYPLYTLPPQMRLAKLVDLKMRHSKLKQLWNNQRLENLKFLDLSHSKYLMKVPSFFELPNLEKLKLEGCVDLVKLHPSLGQHSKLQVLNLKDCKNLKALPRKLEIISLTNLVLSGCNKVGNLPEFGETMKNLVTLDVSETSVVELPESLGLLTGLKTLNLNGCKNLVCLLPVRNLKHLEVLDISGCPSLSGLPENLNENEALEKLDVSGSAIIEVPSSIGHLKKLKTLSFHGCQRRTSNSWIMSLLPNYMFERHPISRGLILPPSICNLKSLTQLNLSYCNIDDGSIPDDLSGLSSLERLDLSGNMFVNLPAISSLLNLGILRLNDCPRLQLFPQPLPAGLGKIEVAECASLETLTVEHLLHILHVVEQGCLKPNCTFGRKDASVITPGREIPPLFENQSVLCLNEFGRASIVIDISPGDEWHGIMLCTVLDDDIFYIRKARQKQYDVPVGQPQWSSYGISRSDSLGGHCVPGRVGMKSPHLWIMFWEFKMTKSRQISLEFMDGVPRTPPHDKIPIKVGWHVITEGDMEKWGISMNQSHVPRFIDEVEEQGQCSLSLEERPRFVLIEVESVKKISCLEEEESDDSLIPLILDDASSRFWF